MSLNIKSEPLDDTSDIVDLSSSEDELESTNIIKHPDRPGTPETNCSICLDELNNKSYSNSCWHMFCYECLKRWSTIESSCPLCKKSFRSIYHTFTDQGIHETYEVPIQERTIPPRIFIRPFSEISDVNRIFRMNLFLDIVRRNERLMSNLNNFGDPDHNHNHNHSLRLGNTRYITMRNPNYNNHHYTRVLPPSGGGEAMRIRVYSENMWADPLPDSSGRFRECSSTFYRENPAQMHRLHNFVARDIVAIRTVGISALWQNMPNLNELALTDLILQTITNHDIRDLQTFRFLSPHFGSYTQHFVHELYNFAHSPYDLVGYDRHVVYVTQQRLRPIFEPELIIEDVTFEAAPPIIAGPPPSIELVHTYMAEETIVLDSDDDEVVTNSRLNGQANEVIVLSSSSEDNSDIEILPQSFHPTETLDSSRDQPSTSTGIRDSLIHPNTRYNLRRRRLFTPALNNRCSCGEIRHMTCSCDIQLSRNIYPLGHMRRRIILDTSSSDEETPVLTHVTRPSLHVKSEVVLGKRKRKVKRTKTKKRNTTVGESRSVVQIGNRSRSHSGSSSSSGETDSTRPANNHISRHTNAVR